MRIATLFVSAVVVATVCAVVAENADYAPDPSWKAPAPAAGRHNPLASDSSSVKSGKDLFDANCAMCHGFDGRGIANAANFHVPAVQKETDGTLFWKMTTGHAVKGMPSFQRLTETQRWQLVTYLRTFKGK
jgi:mono/diheme cytochrome c family protein